MSVAIISAPIGNLDTYEVGARRVERIAMRSDDLAKRVLRFTTSAGDIGIRFDDERRLRDGDVIHADGNLVVVVGVEADDVLIVRPVDIRQALEIAHALGNRHLPAQFEPGALVVRYDPLVEELLRERDVPYVRDARVAGQAFRHAHAPHSHA